MPSNDEVIESLMTAIKATADAATHAAEKNVGGPAQQFAAASHELADALGSSLKIQINPGR